MSNSSSQIRKVEDHFSETARLWDQLYDGKQSFITRTFDKMFRKDIWERYWKTLELLGKDLSDKTVLDIGCGAGTYCIEATRRGARNVLGVDVAPGMIEHARRKAEAAACSDRCSFLCNEFPDAVTDTDFDFTILMGVMDYVDHPVPFLEAVRRATSGVAILSFPGEHWFRGPFRKLRYRMLGRCEVHNYSRSKIEELMTAAGFREVKIQTLPHSGICHIVAAHT